MVSPNIVNGIDYASRVADYYFAWQDVARDDCAESTSASAPMRTPGSKLPRRRFSALRSIWTPCNWALARGEAG